MQLNPKNIGIAVTLITTLGGGIAYGVDFLIEYGRLKAKEELNEEYNEVIVESIVTRNQLELCCSE